MSLTISGKWQPIQPAVPTFACIFPVSTAPDPIATVIKVEIKGKIEGHPAFK